MTVDGILADVAHRFESLGLSYVVGGSLASSSWGQMRQTNDADIALILPYERIDEFVSAFPDPYYLSRNELESALDSADTYRMAQILHTGEAFSIDLFLLEEGDYEMSELGRARVIELLPGSHVRFSAPENIVIAKLRWFVAGNRVSDRQWNDIVQVLEVQHGHLDEEYLNLWAEHFEMRDLLDEARSQVRTV